VQETAYVYTWDSAKRRKQGDQQAAVLDTQTPGLKVLVINVEALSHTSDALDLCRKFLRAHKSMIVVDESTLMQDPRSTRSKRLLDLASRAPYKRILTGSPSKGKPTDLFTQFQFLGNGLLGHTSFYTFRARYCTLREIVASGRTLKVVTGAQNTEELANRVQRHSFRRRKKDCLDLPEKVYERREVELTEEQKQAYKEMRTTAMAVLHSGDTVTTQVVVTQLMRLHQILCGHAKLDDGRVMRLASNRITALQEILEDSDEQTIIWCSYRSDLAAVSRHLKQKYGEEAVAEWYGDIPQAQRETGELDFQAGRRRFMVASQQAGGKGRNWTAATVVVYYSNSHDLELREQSEDRAHRIGQKNTVTYVDLVVPNSLDEKIIESLRKKKVVVQDILKDGADRWI
jgi:SNF2 family DNA or RNA helicase